jgi:hypothetical protein
MLNVILAESFFIVVLNVVKLSVVTPNVVAPMNYRQKILEKQKYHNGAVEMLR